MKALLATVCLLVLVSLGCAEANTPAPPAGQVESLTERAGEVTLRGNPVTLVGDPVNVGDTAPDFVAVKQDMTEAKLSDYKGKQIVLSVVPSLDTKVCSLQTHMFNEKAASLGDDVVILTISMDLPMAQKRFCAAEGIDQVVTLSDFRYWDFAKAYGQRIKESGLLARAIYVIDAEGVVQHREIVPELTTEPDYDAALKALGA